MGQSPQGRAVPRSRGPALGTEDAAAKGCHGDGTIASLGCDLVPTGVTGEEGTPRVAGDPSGRCPSPSGAAAPRGLSGGSGRRGRVTPGGDSSGSGLGHHSRACSAIPPKSRGCDGDNSLRVFLPEALARLGLSRGGRMEPSWENPVSCRRLKVIFFPFVSIRVCARE